MKVTSAQAAKILRNLTNELSDLLRLESKVSTFVAAVGEDPESVRPAYSFEETTAKKKELEEKIRKIKHALNVFNTDTVVPGFGMTVDEVLVYMPQLTADVSRLSELKSALPKERVDSYGKTSVGLIDYRYANYDIAAAEREYQAAADTLAKLQLALDAVNNTAEFEIDI